MCVRLERVVRDGRGVSVLRATTCLPEADLYSRQMCAYPAMEIVQRTTAELRYVSRVWGPRAATVEGVAFVGVGAGLVWRRDSWLVWYMGDVSCVLMEVYCWNNWGSYWGLHAVPEKGV